MILSDLDNIVYNKFTNGEITLAEYIKYQNRDKIMNYEDKYKQALSMATFYNNELLTDNQRKMLEDIFPELAEPDDERIRKKLICFVENWKNFNPNSPFDDYAVYTSDSCECDKILAWLEKQGKQLDPDKVIEWLECKAFQGWAEEINIKQIVNKFIKDFEI